MWGETVQPGLSTEGLQLGSFQWLKCLDIGTIPTEKGKEKKMSLTHCKFDRHKNLTLVGRQCKTNSLRSVWVILILSSNNYL